jgi:hypothetical protein
MESGALHERKVYAIRREGEHPGRQRLYEVAKFYIFLQNCHNCKVAALGGPMRAALNVLNLVHSVHSRWLSMKDGRWQSHPLLCSRCVARIIECPHAVSCYWLWTPVTIVATG